MFFALSIILLQACGGNQSTESQPSDETTTETTGQTPEMKTAAHGDGPEFTSAFVCPMHCAGSGSDQAGTCPSCGMDYIAQSEHTSDGHNHHEGHDHDH